MFEREKMHKLTKNDVVKGSVILKDAFQDDPLWNKLFKNEDDTEEKLLAFFKFPLLLCLAYGEVYAASDEMEGICACLPGSKSSNSIWRMIRSGAFGPAMRMGSSVGSKMGKIFKPVESIRKNSMKGRDYIYLYILGVASRYQGQGYGGGLLRALLDRYDMAEIPVYLETETEDNVRLYEKFGFKVLKKVTLPVLELPFWCMLREPQVRDVINV